MHRIIMLLHKLLTYKFRIYKNNPSICSFCVIKYELKARSEMCMINKIII